MVENLSHLVKPPFGLAYYLNGIDNYILIPLSDSLKKALSEAPVTICFWFCLLNTLDNWHNYLSWTVTNDTGSCIARVEKANDHRSIYTRWIAETSAKGDNPDDGGFWVREPDMGVKPYQWMFYTSKADGNYIYEYLNANLVLKNTQNDKLADMTGDLIIEGREHSYMMAELRIYDRALTDGEISDLYNVRRNIMDGCVLKLGTVGLVKGGGTKWLDESPYGNHGTVYGAKRVRCCHCNPIMEYGTATPI